MCLLNKHNYFHKSHPLFLTINNNNFFFHINDKKKTTIIKNNVFANKKKIYSFIFQNNNLSISFLHYKTFIFIY